MVLAIGMYPRKRYLGGKCYAFGQRSPAGSRNNYQAAKHRILTELSPSRCLHKLPVDRDTYRLQSDLGMKKTRTAILVSFINIQRQRMASF
ncbi:hypothetical protein RRG08_049760 [Elysia crispata]|uniref:Uncharacterized protein n=1 Tax=Elysia crispata TaxID=231223 RepID=A0AAE0ZDU7_9GAST|nr:hypothetical protein RRG08_049760 [Elysia crispata]